MTQAEDRRIKRFIRDSTSFLLTLEATTNRYLDARLAIRNYFPEFEHLLMKLREEALALGGRDYAANRIAKDEEDAE